MVLFADDTSIIITDSNWQDFNINANQMFQDIKTRFKVNLLTLNFNKTQYLNLEVRIIKMPIHKLNMIRNV
jgi:hypothetical protein